MKEKRKKKNYGSYLKRHLGIYAVLWLILTYVFLQIAYYVIFHMIEQKSAVNFYESMETIQYVMKDHKLSDEKVEVMEALQTMSDAGDYYVSNSGNPTARNYGSILGLQFGKAQAFLFWSDAGADGNDNIYLPGVGKGMGFILDGETDEVIFDSQWKEPVRYLYLRNLDEHWDSCVVTSYVSAYHLYYCPESKLNALSDELSEISSQWYEKLKESGQYTTEKRLIWRIDEFYLKEDEYFPSKVSLYYVDIRQHVWAKDRYPDELLETREIVRDDLKDWQIYRIDSEKEATLGGELYNAGIGMPQDSFDRWTPDEAFRTKALKTILENQKERGSYSMVSDIGNSWSEGNPFLYFLNGEMIFVRTAYFQDVTGHLYRACSYQSISELFGMNLSAIVGCGFVLALFLTALAFLTAYVAYLKARSIFITGEYREMLMDSMAHDLKSPLMAVSGYADNLREHISDEKRDHYAEQIQKSVSYMNEIVMKNLEILKFAKENKKVVRKPTDVRVLFEEAFSRYQEEISKRGLKVNLDGKMVARGDEALLEKVAENLVTNAIRYAKDGGEIQATFSDHRLIIRNETELSYDGDLKHLWEPFVRGEDSRTGKGTGLGLAIASNVLDRHDWKYRLRYDKETKVFQCEIRIPFGILF